MDLRRKGGICAMAYEKIIEKVFSYRGYQCYVVFLPTGWRCGYVGISASKGIKPAEEYDTLQCHGGITYNESTCPIPGISAPDFWWIGFDCAHYMDGTDLNSYLKHYKVFEPGHFLPLEGEIRTIEFCEKELKNIVDQLEEA